MPVMRYIVEQRRGDGEWKINGVFRHTEKGKAAAFHRRNKIRRKGKNARLREAQLNRVGRVIRKWEIGKAVIRAYPFAGSVKNAANRRRVYDLMVRMGGRWTSGDRETKHTAGGNVSDHWIGVTSSWADDYGWSVWLPGQTAKQNAAAAALRSKFDSLRLKQVYDEPHGSGPHIHVAGKR